MHVPQPEPGTSPIAVSRGGMLAHRGSSPSLPSLPSQTNRRPGALPALPGHQLPPEPSPTEPAIPPRPPKQGGDRRVCRCNLILNIRGTVNKGTSRLDSRKTN